jgi:glutathione S-transferase
MVGKKLDYLERKLSGQNYLCGETMSVADPYLFAMLGWTEHLGIDLAKWPNLTAFRERMKQREAVQTVLRAEGLA